MAKKKRRLKNPLKAIKKKLSGKPRRRNHAPHSLEPESSSSTSMSPLFPLSDTPTLDGLAEEHDVTSGLNAESSLDDLWADDNAASALESSSDEDLWCDDAASSVEEGHALPPWYDMSSYSELESDSLTESSSEDEDLLQQISDSSSEDECVFDHYKICDDETDYSEFSSDSDSSSESSSEFGLGSVGGQYDSSTTWELPIDAQARSVQSATKGGLDNLDVSQSNGWASLILTDAHRLADQEAGVIYDKQEQMALTLDGGSFLWSQTETAAENPDFSKLDDEALSRKNGNFLVARSTAMAKEQGGKKSEYWAKAIEELRSDPRLIFVMTADGSFYAGESELDVVHHSSLAGGGSVTGAGEISLSGGKPTAMNNFSGHYQPGPFSMWMVVAELQRGGVALGGVDMELHAVDSHFKADWFYNTFDVMAPKSHKRFLPTDPGEAVARMNDRITMDDFRYSMKYKCWGETPEYGDMGDQDAESSSDSSSWEPMPYISTLGYD